MKSSIKILLIPFLVFPSLQSMIVKKTIKKSNITTFLKRSYSTTDSDLANYYLTRPWLFDSTDSATVIEASKNLTKYGPLLYAQCKDPLEKQDIKKLSKKNSLIAQKKLVTLHKQRIADCCFIGIHAFTASLLLPFVTKDPISASIFVANSGFFVLDVLDAKNRSEVTKAFQSIIDLDVVIANYDEIQQKEFKKLQD